MSELESSPSIVSTSPSNADESFISVAGPKRTKKNYQEAFLKTLEASSSRIENVLCVIEKFNDCDQKILEIQNDMLKVEQERNAILLQMANDNRNAQSELIELLKKNKEHNN